METRLKYRVVVPVVLVLVVLYLLLSQQSKTFQSNDAYQIEELKGKLLEKEEEIAKLHAQQHHVDVQDHVDMANVRKPLTILPRHITVRPTLPYVDKVMNIRSFNGYKLVHLDLKGAAPKMAYLMKLLPIFKSWGATGLLVEYEDMFPYDGDLSVLKSHYAYSVKEVTEFLDEVKKHDLLMVPLVQTFGHMEFVLKHPKFAHLRHIANMTTAIDPNNKDSLPLVNMIVAQIIKIHKAYIKYLHIGGDEVWSLKECAGCPPASEVYLKHMIPVVDNVVSNKLTPILWDDMMRRWNVEHLKKIASHGVEPMVWAYPPQLDNHFAEGMWQRYSQAFPKLWIASAFKGADTPSTNFVPVQDRIENQKSWLKIYSTLADQSMKVNGIALTGWSRYDHYATLCELLPAGLPSLALCLAVLKQGELSNETLWSVSKELGFKSSIVLNFRHIPSDVKRRDEGTFLGHSVYGIVLTLRKAYNALHAVETRMSAWFNHRQSVKAKISIYQLTIASQRIESATGRLTELNKMAKKKLSVLYNYDMIEEWIWDKIRSKLTRVQQLKKLLIEVRNATMKAEQKTGK